MYLTYIKKFKLRIFLISIKKFLMGTLKKENKRSLSDRLF
mgnify:CR=1 FL=1